MARRPKAHLIDTNVILRYLMGDVPAHTARATALMERLESGAEEAEILESVVAEAVWTLESFYRAARPEIGEKLAGILRFRGVRAPTKSLLINALARFATTPADFVDCLLAAKATHDGSTMYSYDAKDFRRLGAPWEPPA